MLWHQVCIACCNMRSCRREPPALSLQGAGSDSSVWHMQPRDQAQDSRAMRRSSLPHICSLRDSQLSVTHVIAGLSAVVQGLHQNVCSLAPSDPLALRRHLLVEGMYQDSRNPMSLGVFTLVFSETLIFNSMHLNFYMLLVLAVELVRVPLYEERRLRRIFEAAGMGPQYEEYCNRVPRWLPCTGP